MTQFDRKFPIDWLTKAVLSENPWFRDLLRYWRPAGDAVGASRGSGEASLGRCSEAKSDLKILRVAFRNNYMNFYCGGQSLAKVNFGRDGLQAKIHNKYVYGDKGGGQEYIKLTSAGFRERETGRLVPYTGFDQWIKNAKEYGGREKHFVDLLVAHNPNVIDLEMGLPAYSTVPGENHAPRMDLVALEPKNGWWQIVFWEAKLVGDERARCSGDRLPKVVTEQLQPYRDWLNHGDHLKTVAQAYEQNCRLLVDLHKVACAARLGIDKLGRGIQEVADRNERPLLVDEKPRLLIIYDEADQAFRNKHLDKLQDAGWRVKVVERARDLDSKWPLDPHSDCSPWHAADRWQLHRDRAPAGRPYHPGRRASAGCP